MNINIAAVAENEANRKHITLTHGGGVTTLTINSNKVTYKGVPASQLSDEKKKKLENVILFMYIESLQQVPILKYI